MPTKHTPDTASVASKQDRLSGTSAVVVEAPRARISIEIERMARGPAKVSIRVDGDDIDSVAEEVYAAYERLTAKVDKLTPEEGIAV